MQPQQPNYDFIVNPGKPARNPLLPTGNSKQARIIIAAVGAIVLILVAVVVMSLISSAGSAGKEAMTKAAQQQAELIRISKIGVDKARDPATRNLAMTTSVTLQSDQAILQGYTKLKPKELALGRSTKTDTDLTTAEQSNRFDTIFTQTLQTQLAQYQQTLKTAHDKSDNKKLKSSLAELYTHAGQLVNKK